MKLGTIGLLNSKRGVIGLMLILASTAMVFVGKLSATDWMNYTKWIGTLVVASHTVTGTVETLKKNDANIPEARVIPPS
jgi:hypothetical protein